MRRSRWQRALLVVLLIVAVLAAVMYGVRTYRSYQVLRSAQQLGERDLGSIRGWMTLGFIARTYHVPEDALIARLGLPPDTSPHTDIRSLARQHGRSVTDAVQEVQRAVAELRRSAPPQPPASPPPPDPGGGP
jgi:Tfp pilus assembly protein PilE